MTSLKRNFDNFVQLKKIGQKGQPQSNFEKILTNDFKHDDHFGHTSLIQQIKFKNNLLKNYDKDGKLSNQQNSLTYCQKYAKILSQKYDLAPKLNSTSSSKQLKKTQKNSLKYFNDQEQIGRILIEGKIYLQSSHSEFDNSFEKLSYKIKQVWFILEQKTKRLNQSDHQVIEQLTLLQLFASKINNKIIKQHITPFSLFAQQFKSTTPKRVKSYLQIGKITVDNNTSAKFQSHNQSKKIQDSNFVTPYSPDLLSGYDEKDNQSNLLISFKPNLENSQNGFETLKYSQSELNINFSKNLAKGFKQVHKEDDGGQLPFSPVQPYRLHKLQTSGTKKETIKEESDSLFLIYDDAVIRAVTSEITISVKKGTKEQRNLTQKILSIYSQSISEISLTIQSLHAQMCQQKSLMEKQWDEILDYVDRDYKDMHSLLVLQKTENQLKDKKFLENLELIQNQLIEELFAEKQSRKAEENVLTQILANLVDSIQEKVD